MKTERPFLPPVDRAAALRLLRDRYPDVILWFGKNTLHYWALVNNQLMEADTPEQLARMIDSAGPRPLWRPRQRYGRAITDQGDRHVDVRRRP